ncbi:MAG: hypothetical protein HONBIEJF_01323 [Fimbriimonadaceae bacterium]|nr:hypothetical protein [Fimbriimonadaceae bacterium]
MAAAPAEPVTQAEMMTVIERVEKSIRKVLRIKSVAQRPATSTQDKAPASRSSLLLEFKRLYDLAKPSFRFMPPKLPVDARAKASSEAANRALAELVSNGFVSPVGPIAVGPEESMTLEDFADSVGFFLARVADLTHTPTRKYSPYLQGDEDLTINPARKRDK